MWKEGKIILLAIATDYSNKLLPRLARYTVSSLPWNILHDEPKYLLQGTSKNVSLFRPCEASALVKRKIRARRIAAPGSCSRVPVLFTRATGSQGSGFRVLSSLWREELGNEVVTCAQSSAFYVPQSLFLMAGMIIFVFSTRILAFLA